MIDLKFERDDGKPFKILARGDCTSRRMVRLNPQFFPKGVQFIQNEKSPLVLLLDAAQGRTATRELLLELSDTEAMGRTLSSFYLGQADRSILDEQDADLLLIDSYADQNFELHEHARERFKIWIHPKFIRDPERFSQDFVKLGRRSLQQSVNDAVEFIGLVRKKNPGIPVLMLTQQVEYYPKLHSRLEFYELGRLVAERMPGIHFAPPMQKEELELADIGSCGPDLTLHWQKETYAQMVKRAYSSPENEVGTEAPAPTEADPGSVVANDGEVHVSYRSGCPCCQAGCDQFVEGSMASMLRYARIPELNNPPPVYTPAVIAIDDLRDFDAWESHIKTFSSGNRLREKKKALRLGYSTKRFAPQLWIPDMYAVDTSKDVRSGGVMRGGYIKSIEERGGYPARAWEPKTPPCPLHWSLQFGVFVAEQGHRQGEIETHERLVAYLSLRRTGDLITYAQIIGHGSHLNDGVMILLHHDVVEWIGTAGKVLTDGATHLMYGAMESGKEGLKNWKRRGGFTAQKFVISR